MEINTAYYIMCGCVSVHVSVLFFFDNFCNCSTIVIQTKKVFWAEKCLKKKQTILIFKLFLQIWLLLFNRFALAFFSLFKMILCKIIFFLYLSVFDCVSVYVNETKKKKKRMNLSYSIYIFFILDFFLILLLLTCYIFIGVLVCVCVCFSVCMFV